MEKWKKASLKSNLLFKYTPLNLEKIKKLKNKKFKVKKKSKFFYEVKDVNILIFFGDLILDDEKL